MRAFLESISYKEKYVWVELLTNVFATVYYLVNVLKVPGGFFSGDPVIAKIVVEVIVLSIVLSILIYILLSIFSGPKVQADISDERDLRIAANGNTIAYGVLGFCIVMIIGHIVISYIFPQSFFGRAHGLDDSIYAGLRPMFFIHLLFLSLIISSMAKSLTQLFRYRRGY